MDLKFYAKATSAFKTAVKSLFFFLCIAAGTKADAQLTGTGLDLVGSQKNMVIIPASPSVNISTNITLEAWINYSVTSGTQDVISKSSNVTNNGYIFPRTTDGWRNVQFLLHVGGTWRVLTVPYSGATQAYRNQWHHLAATYDGFYMRIYIDGVLTGTPLSVSGSITVNNNPLTLGGQTGYNNEYFTGGLDDIRVWNRALSQCEIVNNKNCELTGTEPGLSAYYKLNQGLAGLPNLLETTVNDASPNGNNGTLSGFLLAGLNSNWSTGTLTAGSYCGAYTPIQATAGAAATSVAIGDDIALTATGGDTYAWVGPNGFTSTEQNPVIPNASLASAGIYTVTATKNGCSATSSVTIAVANRAKALVFDGVDDEVRIPNSNTLNSNTFTLETWMYPTSNFPLTQSVVSKATVSPDRGFIFPRTDDGWVNCAVWFTVNGNWTSYSVPFPGLNKWTHVAATYDGFSLKIYINGNLVRTEMLTGSVNWSNADMVLGGQPGYVQHYKGKLDEMRIWSRALTQCELQNNITCELNGANNALAGLSGLSAYFRFNQGLEGIANNGINTLVDSSSHANTGTLVNFDLDGLLSNWGSGGTVNNAVCSPFLATDVTIGNNGPVVEVGQPINLTVSSGTSWAWTGPNGFTSTQQNPVINNSTTAMSGIYTVAVTGNGCTTTASTKLQVAYKAYSLNFDGQDDQITVPNKASLNMSSQITLEAWIHPTDNTKPIQDVMSKSTLAENTGYIFPRTDNAWASYTFYLHINNQWQILAAPYPALNEWHHVAATYDGFYMRIYLDGVLSASKQVSGNITQNTNNLVLGQQPGFHEYYGGYVDEARVWNRALSQCEIINNMKCELNAPQHPTLVAYYRFNQGFGDADNTAINTLIDATSEANNGVLQNFTLQGLTSNWATYFSTEKGSNICELYNEPPVVAQANGNSFAIGSTIKLYGSGGSQYFWDGPNSFAATGQSATVNNAQPASSGVYTLAVPFVNCVVNKSLRIDVTTVAPISASGPLNFCPSGSVTLNTPNPGTAYQWYRNDTLIQGANAASYTATQSGRYAVGVTNNSVVTISESVTVTVQDLSGPVPAVAQLPTINLQAPGTVTTIPTAIDNCAGTVTATTTSPLTYNSGGTYTILWKYDDGNGNITTQGQNVVVTQIGDNTPPVLTVPSNIVLNATSCTAVGNFTATATDDSGDPVTITYSINPGSSFAIGTTTVTVTAKDASNNTSTGSFTVTVADNTPPVMTLPANISATSGTGINVGTATATDNCGTPVITHSNIPSVFPLGVTNITWTATDAAGNFVTGVQKVTVTDVTAPVLSGVPANTTANCGVLPAVPTVTATDNFDANPVVTYTTSTSGNTVTRTWTATDASGNSSSASQVITLVQAAAPIIAGPVSGSTVTQNPLQAALDFNVFARNNVTFGNGQSHGPVAMGGNLTINGSYSVSNNSQGTFKVSNVPVTLLMGGKVNYQSGNSVNVNQSGYVKIGDATGSYVWYKDQNNAYSNIRITPGANYNGSPMINLQTNSQALNVSATNNPVFQSNVIDFGTAFTQLQASATSLSGLTANAALTNPNGGSIPSTNLPSQVKINLANGVNVLNVSGSDLNNLQNFTFNNAPSASRILVVNVNAPGSFSWNVFNSGGIGDQDTKYILYNFYNTTSLTVQGNGAVMGTLLAPNADITKNVSQNITGQIIGQSFLHNSGTNTYNKFDGTITSGSTTTIGQNSNNTRTTNNSTCSYTVNGNEFNVTVTAADNCSVPVVNYTLTGATTGTGTSLAGVNLNVGTTTVTWTATNGSAASTYSFTVTVQGSNPAAPVVTAADNCGNTVLTATGSNLLWNTGATASSITVSNAGTYTVTQTVNGCTSTAASVVAAPKAIPAAPAVSAVNNCGSTILSASGSNLLWNTGATASSITVSDAGNYTVTQTVNGCTSPAATVAAAPKAIPAAPMVTVADNCGSTTLTASGSNLVWNTGATTSSITVNNAGTYTVTQTVNGCTSAAASAVASPKAVPAAPVVTVVNNCGNTVLSTTAAGTLAWSTGANTSSITVTSNGAYQLTATVNGCTSPAAVTNVTIATPVVLAAISGNTTVTAGSATQLSNSTTGGSWSSSNTSVATVSASGLVTGVAQGTAIISYVVTTPQGCATTVTATVTVNPNCIAPAITSANVVASTPAGATACSSAVTYSVNVTGNPAATVTYTLSGATTGSGSGTGSGAVFNTGVTTVVVKAVNGCGSATSTFTVTLKDGTAPVPVVAVLPTITGQCSVSLAAATTTNNNNTNYNCGYKKSWSCSDNCRCCRYACHCRTSSCSCKDYSYRYRGIISMILSYLGDYYGWSSGGDDDDDHDCDKDDDNETPQQNANAPKATDNCKGTIVGTTTDPLTYNTQGTYTIRWKYDDGNGNVTIQEQTVIVSDNTKPVLNVPGNITVNCGSSVTPSGCNSTATATDNCSSATVTYSDVTNGNTIERTWKATDAAGNFSTGVQIITLRDVTKPTISSISDVTVSCSGSTDPSATGRPNATDACSDVTLTYSDATSGSVITRTWRATDAAGNFTTTTQRITIGSAFNVSVSSVPTSSTYTGGIATNLYLGYGAQSTKLQVCQLPSSGAPYTYVWTGNATNRLNSTSSSAPTFTPTAAGTYTYVVTVTNKFGCTSTDVISICVTDIRVPGTSGNNAKVYVCHKTGSWKNPYQTISVSINAVAAHLNHGCGNNDDDRLGSCDQSPCGNTGAFAATGTAPVTQGGVTSEGVVSTKETVKATPAAEELKVTVMPNPSTTYFTLKFASASQAPLNLRVMDGNGRVIDARTKIVANSTIQIGGGYSSGTYYAEITQGTERKVIQLIKARG